MTLRGLRFALWIAAAVAIAIYGVALLTVRNPDPPTLEATPYRPTFALPDTSGRVRTVEEFRGKHLLVFFGFTHCPDVCPTTLAEVTLVMDGLGDDAAQVQPIFVSVDPTRDRPILPGYLGAFHPSVIGLAGTDEEARAVASSFRVYFAREDDPTSPDGYTMAHSTGLQLVGPDGEWIRQFSYGTPADEILADLRGRL